jgi:hypothetical protein
MEDDAVKTIRLSSDKAIKAHKKLKAYAALQGQSMGDAVADLVSEIDLQKEISEEA